jgi:hypothetical protein
LKSAEKNSDRLLLSLLFAALCFPALQYLTGLFAPGKKLQGAFESSPDAEITMSGWFDGSYQKQKDAFLTGEFNFRTCFSRLRFQEEFSIFSKAHARYVVVGYENYLYETGYFDAYFGRDFVGRAKTHDILKKFRCAQDSMTVHHKLLLTILAPGKASFYPEYIPGHYRAEPRASNYSCIAEMADSLGINVIDFNADFVKRKNTSKYPLYPRYGIHWSNYGSIMAFDSVVHYTEMKLNTNLPDIRITGITVSDSLRHTDNDVLKTLNLIWEPAGDKMAYPEWKVDFDSTRHRKLNLLVVADSFWWYIYSTTLPSNIFSPLSFWYYNHEMYPETFEHPRYVRRMNYYQRIREADVIIIMHSESTLSRFGNGFVDMVYDTWCRPDKVREEMQQIKQNISMTPDWARAVEEKAQKFNVSIDSMMTIDAIYMLGK